MHSSPGMIYGHGLITNYKRSLSPGKTLILYGSRGTTLADEVAHYIGLHLDDPKKYPDLVARQDLAVISSAKMSMVEQCNPSARKDDLSPDYWKAATVIDYPKVITPGTYYDDVKLNVLENVNFYGLKPEFIYEVKQEILLSKLIGELPFNIIHLGACQAKNFSDPLVILRPEISKKIANKKIKVEMKREDPELLAKLYQEKVNSSTPSWSLGAGPGFSTSSNLSWNLGAGAGFATSSGFGGASAKIFASLDTVTQQSPTLVNGHFPPQYFCLISGCGYSGDWDAASVNCSKCGKDGKYEIGYVCDNQACLLYERGHRQYKKDKNDLKCEICGNRLM